MSRRPTSLTVAFGGGKQRSHPYRQWWDPVLESWRHAAAPGVIMAPEKTARGRTLQEASLFAGGRIKMTHGVESCHTPVLKINQNRFKRALMNRGLKGIIRDSGWDSGRGSRQVVWTRKEVCTNSQIVQVRIGTDACPEVKGWNCMT